LSGKIKVFLEKEKKEKIFGSILKINSRERKKEKKSEKRKKVNLVLLLINCLVCAAS